MYTYGQLATSRENPVIAAGAEAALSREGHFRRLWAAYSLAHAASWRRAPRVRARPPRRPGQAGGSAVAEAPGLALLPQQLLRRGLELGPNKIFAAPSCKIECVW